MEKTNGVMSLLGLTAQLGAQGLPNVGQVSTGSEDLSFADALKGTAKTDLKEQPENLVVRKQTVVETGSNNSMKNIKNSENVDTANKNTSLDKEKIEKVSDEVTKAADEIKEKIQNTFSKSEEEVEEAMEVLSLTAVDLFDVTSLRSLVMELTETKDSIELITNTELYDGLMEVTNLSENLLNEISKEFGIDTDSLKEMISTEAFENAMVASLNEITENEAVVLTDAVKTEANTEAITEGKAGDSVKNVNTYEANNESIPVTVEVTKETAKETAKETSLDEPVVTVNSNETVEALETKPVTQAETSQNENSSNEQNSKKQNLSEKTNVFEMSNGSTQVVTQTVNTVGDIVETVTSYTSYADTENIMRQVTDYVKVNITEDVTKMEMQLHPASLGTVNMQINSQNGQVTAHLTVQNELVKSILESQMVKLQETFNEQGTKVTAIEVSVASYNLDSSTNNNFSESADKQSGRGNRRRGINLNEIGSLDELTDEEQLQAEVMEMNGSSVNYTA